MIKKKLILCVSLLFGGVMLFAQNSDSLNESKRFKHLVGLQANALFRQILNFSGANTPVNNPYLLTYSIVTPKKGWGLDAGMGYTYNKTFETDGNVKKNNFINDLYFRLGPQKMLPLNRRFSAQIAFHLLFEILNSDTQTESNFGSQITRVITKSSSVRYGGGPALGLRYRVSNRVLLGTEASYYFRKGQLKSDLKTETIFQGNIIQEDISNTNNDLTQVVFNPPAVLFLVLRF